MAKQPKQFDENSKLGFMRLIQVYNVVTIFAVILVMLFVRGSTVKLDLGVIANVVLLLSQAMVVWLIAHRKIYTRQIVMGLEVFEVVVLTVNDIATGTFSIGGLVGNAIAPGIVFLYFLLSPRAKAVLVQPWNDRSISQLQEDHNRKLWDPKSGAFWMRMLLYFFAFSIMGHWMEMGVQVLVQNGLFPGTLASPDSLTWRDNLNPFPIYGIAVVICGLLLYPAYLVLRRNLPQKWMAFALSFLLNMTFCVVAELVLGFFFNADYHAWDYRDQFMNFHGQICLLYSIAFGVVSSIITWFIFPLMERSLGNVKRDVFYVAFAVSVVLYIVIFATYNIDPIVDLEQMAASSTPEASSLAEGASSAPAEAASSSLPQAA